MRVSDFKNYSTEHFNKCLVCNQALVITRSMMYCNFEAERHNNKIKTNFYHADGVINRIDLYIYKDQYDDLGERIYLKFFLNQEKTVIVGKFNKDNDTYVPQLIDLDLDTVTYSGVKDIIVFA